MSGFFNDVGSLKSVDLIPILSYQWLRSAKALARFRYSELRLVGEIQPELHLKLAWLDTTFLLWC